MSKEIKLVAKVASKGKDGKTYWHNVGRAFRTTKKDDGTFILNIPSLNIVVMEAKEKPETEKSGQKVEPSDQSLETIEEGAEA